MAGKQGGPKEAVAVWEETLQVGDTSRTNPFLLIRYVQGG